MRSKPKLSLLFVTITLAIVGALAVSGVITTSRTFESSGSVKAVNVQVYWDLQCTQVVGEVDWGFPEPGESREITIFVKNTGNYPLTLGMTYGNWSPAEAGNYITLSWDKEGAAIGVDEVVQALLTLDVSASITGITDFSFNIVIAGTG